MLYGKFFTANPIGGHQRIDKSTTWKNPLVLVTSMVHLSWELWYLEFQYQQWNGADHETIRLSSKNPEHAHLAVWKTTWPIHTQQWPLRAILYYSVIEIVLSLSMKTPTGVIEGQKCRRNNCNTWSSNSDLTFSYSCCNRACLSQFGLVSHKHTCIQRRSSSSWFSFTNPCLDDEDDENDVDLLIIILLLSPSLACSNSLLSSLARFKCIFLISLSLIFTLWPSGLAKSTIRKVLFVLFFFFVNNHLVWSSSRDHEICLHLKIIDIFMYLILWDRFWLVHILFVRTVNISIFCTTPIGLPFTPSLSRLFCARLLYSLFMWLIFLLLTPNYPDLLLWFSL